MIDRDFASRRDQGFARQNGGIHRGNEYEIGEMPPSETRIIPRLTIPWPSVHSTFSCRTKR